jgi:hypothetical protein
MKPFELKALFAVMAVITLLYFSAGTVAAQSLF